MSAIEDYSDLAALAEEQYGASDMLLEFQRFVAMAETKLNRELRVAGMETVDTITVVDGVGPLPSDFLEFRDVRYGSYPALSAATWSYLRNRYRCAGVPVAYSVIGSSIYARPTFSGDLDVVYYAKIPALTPAAPTNWLLTAAPDLYLFATVLEMAIWNRDAEKGTGFRDLYRNALDTLKMADNSARWANARISIGGPTP